MEKNFKNCKAKKEMGQDGMRKEDFSKLIENKTSEELHMILSKYANGFINLTSKQVDRVIKLKDKLVEERKAKRV